jgi:hypothetical protein
MIETSAELAPGAEPLIDIGDAGSVFGTVVWAAGGRAGLRFNEPFDWSLLLGPRSEALSGTPRFGAVAHSRLQILRFPRN